MQIGVVAKKTGVSVDAIRFYERNGLLPRPPRTLGAFASTAKTTSRHWYSSAACKVLDSSSARFKAF